MNAIERLREWLPKRSNYTDTAFRERVYQGHADLAAVDALYQAAKRSVELGDSANAVLMGRMTDAHAALAAAVRRVEGEA